MTATVGSETIELQASLDAFARLGEDVSGGARTVQGWFGG
mgnify:CR=1 FL=1